MVSYLGKYLDDTQDFFGDGTRHRLGWQEGHHRRHDAGVHGRDEVYRAQLHTAERDTLGAAQGIRDQSQTIQLMARLALMAV